MKFRKMVSIGLTFLLCGSMAGCMGLGDDNNSGLSNPGASQTLNVAYFNGGVSSEWLRELEAEYEKENSDVEVIINSDLKDELKNQQLMADIRNRNEDVFFTHTISYGEFVNRGLFAEITDIVKSPAAEGEDTVEARMNESIRKIYNVDDKYYAVPFYTNFSGAVYDVDLFEEKQLYIGKNGGYVGVDQTTGEWTGEKSLGKDGLPNTYDDGLPATFEEYKTWLNYISKSRGVIPYIWNTDDSYRMSYLDSLWIGYEGVNDFSLNNSFSGKTKGGQEITPANAYLLRDFKGRQFALEMSKEIISNRYYHPDSVNGSITHIEAQNAFLRSRPDNKPIAMILEGGWWENEARSTFASLASRNEKYAHGNRRFAYMPVPKYDANAEPGESFYCTSADTAVAINASTKNLELAKDFLKFTLTEHAMSTFTKYMGITRPYDYELEEGVYEQLTPFGKNFWDLVNAETSKIYYPEPSNAFRRNTTYFGVYEWQFGTTLNGTEYVDPFLVFLNNRNVTVAQYLQGMKEFYSPEDYTEEYNHWLTTQK